ncbi:hypothetical protein ACUY2E_01735 [Corynebacterium confusum]|uniref:hypothetical protein n=1 Tax=uncultured Corynebacterium sp. TaxID=159447 RepID=UPI0025FAC26D|nr:hypothetical protein [uncultured Corynebacterium sp.]
MAHTHGAGRGSGNDPQEPVTAELPVVSAGEQPRRAPGRGALIGAFGILAAIVVIAVIAALSLQRGWLGMSSTDEGEPAPAPASSSSSQVGTSEASSETSSSSVASTAAESSSPASSSASSSGSSSGSRSSDRAAAAAPTTRASEPTPEARPPRYTSAAPGSNQTSAVFADSVYSAFTSAYSQSGNPNTPVEAYSPVTGQWYKMQCTGTANAVTCRGGDGAVVNIS